MWKVLSFMILLLVAIVSPDENVKSPECNGPPPFRVSPRECCDKPQFKPDFKACLNQTRDLIMKKIRDGKGEGETDPATGDEDACLTNCFFNKNVFTDTGVARDDLVSVLESQSDDAEWKSVHSKAVDKCIADLEPEFQNQENTKWIRKCNRIAVRMIMCLNVEYFANCPETYFKKDNEKCVALQEHIKQCPMPGPWGPGKGGGGRHFKGRNGPGNRGFGPPEGFPDGPHQFGPGDRGFDGPSPFGHGIYSEGPFGYL